MSERNQQRLDAPEEFERQMREEARPARGAPEDGPGELARLLQEAERIAAARRRERWRKLRETLPALVALAGLGLAALLVWLLFG